MTSSIINEDPERGKAVPAAGGPAPDAPRRRYPLLCVHCGDVAARCPDGVYLCSDCFAEIHQNRIPFLARITSRGGGCRRRGRAPAEHDGGLDNAQRLREDGWEGDRHDQ